MESSPVQCLLHGNQFSSHYAAPIWKDELSGCCLSWAPESSTHCVSRLGTVGVDDQCGRWDLLQCLDAGRPTYCRWEISFLARQTGCRSGSHQDMVQPRRD